MTTRPLTPRGTGLRDYSVATIGSISTLFRGGTVASVRRVGTLSAVNRLGSVDQVRRIGSAGVHGTIHAGRIGSLGRVGSIGYLTRIGTVTRVGSLGQVARLGSVTRVGSLGYLARAGTVGVHGTVSTRGSITIGVVGTINRIGTVSEVSRRGFAGSTLWSRRHTGAGSTYVGSWQYIAPYYVKTIAVLSTMAGSVFVVVGATGTGPTRNTGTLNRTDLGAGTFASLSFTEHYQYVRPIVRVGSVGSGKGSLSVSVVKQA